MKVRKEMTIIERLQQIYRLLELLKNICDIVVALPSVIEVPVNKTILFGLILSITVIKSIIIRYISFNETM